MVEKEIGKILGDPEEAAALKSAVEAFIENKKRPLKAILKITEDPQKCKKITSEKGLADHHVERIVWLADIRNRLGDGGFIIILSALLPK